MDKRTEDIMMAEKIARLAADEGGRVYYVGGFVRDGLMGVECKDVDIEVHGIAPSALEKLLDSLGQRISMGESFGIYGLKGCSVDIAMPRKERQRGQGHKDFDVFVDPFIGTRSAASRRDFTINALMQDVLSGEIIDHFGGREDLNRGILRHVSDDSFGEDPLRVLRCAQFAARFGFAVADETIELCRSMDLSHLSRERVEAELKKALLKAEKPSVFFETLRAMGKIKPWFDELELLIGVKQHERVHAEGDVWTHTMMVLDECAKLRAGSTDTYGFMLAALTHDMGKAFCEVDEKGIIRAEGHELMGLEAAERFIKRISSETRPIKYALELTRLHMEPISMMYRRTDIESTNTLFDSSSVPEDLILFSQADDRGRLSLDPLNSDPAFLWERLKIYREYMSRPYVTGQQLVDAGLAPGRELGEALRYAHKLRLRGVDREKALEMTLERIKET